MKTDDKVENINSENTDIVDAMFEGFNNGDIIVNDDFSIIGVFFQELKDKDEMLTFPTFHIACSNGKVYENFDDLGCDWPDDYRYATDEEAEIFLKQVEDFTGLVWNPSSKKLEHRDESNWRTPKYLYPSTWEEATKNYTSCSDLENELFCCGYEEEFSGKMYSLAQLKLLYDIYVQGNENVKDEVSYAIVSTPWGELECRPYIYGTRNSMFSFRYQEQARLFMTNFEKLLKKCADLSLY